MNLWAAKIGHAFAQIGRAAPVFLAAAVGFGCGGPLGPRHGQRSLPAPNIIEVLPDAGILAGGDTVQIVTRGFVDDFTADLPRVFFGQIPASAVMAVNAYTVAADTPPHPAPEWVDVTVQTTAVPQGARLRGGFSYVDSLTFYGRTILLPSGRLIFVLKRSGSMGSSWFGPPTGCFERTTRWSFVVDEVIASIRNLPGRVRFNVVSFACDRDAWAPESRFATASNKAAAEAWISSKVIGGGSGTGPGLELALQEREVLTLLYASDGSPNCGASGTYGHRNMAIAANTQGAAIHTFGLCSTGRYREFLKELAAWTGGTYTDLATP